MKTKVVHVPNGHKEKTNDELWEDIFSKFRTFAAYELKEILKKHYKAPKILKESEKG